MESNSFERKDTYILIPAYKPDHLMIELLMNLKKEGFDIVVVNDQEKNMILFLKKLNNSRISSIKIQTVVKAQRYALVLRM